MSIICVHVYMNEHAYTSSPWFKSILITLIHFIKNPLLSKKEANGILWTIPYTSSEN